jgi:multiple antibiotic resistance protein
LKFSDLINYFVSLIVICSPLSALPAFLRLTHGRSESEIKRTAIVAGVAVGIILVTVIWLGSLILEFFGVGVPAFQFAGGFVVFLLALSMLQAEPSGMKQTSDEQKALANKQSIAVVPLAIPIMAGPGAISRVIVTVNQYPGVMNQLSMTISALVVAGMLAIVLYFATNIAKALGTTGINIFNRIGGLILAAMATQSMAAGVIGLFPSLQG